VISGCGQSAIDKPRPRASESQRPPEFPLLAHVVVSKAKRFDDYREVARKALTISGVTTADPVTFTEMVIASDKQLTATIAVKGVLEVAAKPIQPYVTAGGFVASGATPSLLVGDLLARALAVEVGDEVTITRAPDPDAVKIARALDEHVEAPPPHRFRVSGIFHIGWEEGDRRLAFANLEAMQKIIGTGDLVDTLEVRLSDVKRAPTVAGELRTVLGGIPYFVQDIYELNPAAPPR
jgi:lipoprotein-releasing system permease protein